MHKRFVRKKGKVFGPYYYTTIRDRNGKPKSYFLSKNKQEALRKERELKKKLEAEYNKPFVLQPRVLAFAGAILLFGLFISLGFEFTGLITGYIELKEPDTEMLDDGTAVQVQSGTERGAWEEIAVAYGTASNLIYSALKFNITEIPPGVRIDNASLSVTCNNDLLEGGESLNFRAFHLYQNYSWTEGTGGSGGDTCTGTEFCWDNLPAAGYYSPTAADNGTFSQGCAGTTVNLNITGMVKSEYQNTSSETVNIGLSSTASTGNEGTNDRVEIASKENTNVSRRPLLNITYTDISAPEWSSQSQNASSIVSDESVLFSAYWTDNINLSYAILSTNETGIWENKTGTYGSPLQIGPGTANWSNFTWQNESAAGTIGWRIYANDTEGNWNETSILAITSTPADTESPNVTLNLPPQDYYNDTSDPLNVTFNCSAVDDGELLNMSLYMTNSTNQSFALSRTTSVSGGTNSTEWVVELENGNYTWNCRSCDTTGKCAWNPSNRSLKINYTDTTDSIASLGTNPIDYYNTTEHTITFDLKCSDNYDTGILQLWGDWTGAWHANKTNITPVNNTYWNVTVDGIPEGTWSWGAYCNDSAGNYDWSDQNRTLSVDNTLPTITIHSPANDTYSYSLIDLNVSANEPIDTWLYNLNSNATNTTFTPNTTITGQEGQNILLVYANDSSGNTNSTTITFTVDTTPPFWSNNSTHPASGTQYSPAQTYQFNTTWSDASSGTDTVLIEHNFTGIPDNYTVSNASSEYYYNWPNLAAGTYIWRMYANDTPGNLNSTDQWIYEVGRASTACNLLITPLGPQPYLTPINASCSCTNPEAPANLYRNSTNATTENNQNVTLAAGNYLYNCSVPATQNYTYTQNTSTYTIMRANHTIHLAINGSESDQGFTYPAQTNVTGWLEINQATSPANLTRNGTAVDTGSPATEITVLGAGPYNYTYAYPESQNYTAQTLTRFLDIDKSPTTLTLAPDPGWSVSNGTQTNVTCYPSNNEVNFSLYRNTTYIGSSIGGSVSDVQTLAPGQYNYTCNTTGSDNYTTASESNILNILLKNASYCYLSFTPPSGQTYPVNLNASCSCTNPEAPATLYRNSTNVTSQNNQPVPLPAGSYEYVCNVSETVNYVPASNTSIYTIYRAPSEVSLLLNGTDGNITVEVNTPVNMAGSMVTPPAGYLEIYDEGQMIESGYDSVSNSTQYSNIGTRNITLYHNGTENYTASYETHYLTVEDTSIPQVLNHTLEPYDPVSGYNITLNATADDDIGVDGIFANITLPDSSVVTFGLPYNYTVNMTGRHNVTFWANDTEGNIGTQENYFIAGNTRVLIQFNTVDANLSGLQVNLSVYFTGTSKELNHYQFAGTETNNHTDILYDLFYRALDGNITVRLNRINLSADSNRTLGLDRTTVSGYLVTYGINSTYGFSSAELVLSYAGTGYSSEDYLGVYKCSDWNFINRTCSGSWETVTAVQEKDADTFTVTATGFSAYSIKQESVPSPPGPEEEPSGPGQSAFTNCTDVWDCDDWSDCTPEGLQFRNCTNIGPCGDGTITENRSCTPPPLPPAPNCSDNIQNQNETDVDCGGSVCPPCEDGKKCVKDTDCINECDEEAGICYKEPGIRMPKYEEVLPWIIPVTIVVLVLVLALILLERKKKRLWELLGLKKKSWFMVFIAGSVLYFVSFLNLSRLKRSRLTKIKEYLKKKK